MKKKVTIKVCDYCGEEEEGDLYVCCVCEKDYCYKCGGDETWSFPDTSLCDNCLSRVWIEFPKLLKNIKEGKV